MSPCRTRPTNGCSTLERDVARAKSREKEREMPKLIRCLAIALGVFLLAVPSMAQATRDTSTMVSDAWITTQIYAKFFADSEIKGRNIDVETVSGVVTLQGTIQSGAERSR